MKKIFSLFAAVLLVAFAAKAATINVDPGDDKLISALSSAAEGDVLVLADGDYNEYSNYIDFAKSVTVKAADGANPVVNVGCYIKVQASVSIQGIKFDGTEQGHNGSSYSHFMRVYNVDKLELDGCGFYNTKANLALEVESSSHIGYLKINNCYFYKGSNSAISIAKGSSAHVCDKIEITNSTFADYGGFNAGLISIKSKGEALTGDPLTDVAVLVDHCTFYNISKTDAGSTYGVLDVRKSANAVVSNCIFANPADLPAGAAAFHRATQLYGGTVSNCLLFNTPNHRTDAINLISPYKDVDPKFVNAEQENYTLADDSPAIGAGTDGSNLGDPFWWPAAPEHTYTVAGDNNVLFVKAWDPTYEANDMSLVDGVYTWKKDNLTLAAGSIAFKVCEDHAWTTCWPSQNYVLNIAEAGIYTITITFEPANENKVSAVATKTGSADVIPTVAMHGNFLGTWADTENFDLDEGNESASLSLTLAAGNYEFGMRIGGSGNWTANGAAFSRENSAAKVVAGQGNLTLNADAAGDYIFTWYYATETLNITFPEIQPAEAPAAAPADPTLPIYQVKAVYSKTYNADCNFGEWGSGTQYAQEDFGKKFVTAASGYFGLEFKSHMDCSEMEALHLDVWIAEDAEIRIVPIHGGTEVGMYASIYGQQWNSIDIQLEYFEGVTNWSDVYQIKIDNASNLTFWINNVYFYTTVAPVVDLEDGYYLIGLKGWTVYDIKDAYKFAANPDQDGEYKLTIALENGDEFKVVEVKNNEIKTWFPGDADNYKVDITHSGEAKDIYFRPDYQGGEGWYEGCIYISAGKVNPYTTWFAVGDTWDTETQSTLTYDMDTEVALVKIAVDKNGQWRAQVKYQGPTSEKGKFYHVGLKLKANNALAGVTIKWEDNVETILKNQSVELAANTEFVFDEPRVQVNGENGNGVLVLDFGYAKAGDEIQIYDVIIEEVEAPVVELEDGYYLIGMNGWSIYDLKDADKFIANTEAEGEWLLANVTLVAGKEFKVVSVVNNNLDAWYGAKDGANYVVTDDVAGVKTIYFRPAYQEAWEGHIYVADNKPTSIDTNIVAPKAVKMIENGQLIIIRDGIRYNAQGQQF